MFSDVFIDENSFLAIVENHTGVTIASAWKEGYRDQSLVIKFKEEEARDRFEHDRYGFVYSLDSGRVYLSGMLPKDSEKFSLKAMYEADYPEVSVIDVRGTHGGFTVKIRTKDERRHHQ